MSRKVTSWLPVARLKAVAEAAGGGATLNDVLLAVVGGAVRRYLIQQKALTPEFPVVLRGDAQAQYQSVMDVFDLLSRIGLSQVGLATKPLVK